MKYKLLATDLDGTLLNKDSIISKENIEAVKNARASGLNVVIASGRSHESIKPFNKILGLVDDNAYGISFNGAVVYKAKNMEILFEKRLSSADCEKIYKVVKAFDKNAPMMLYTPQGDTFYFEIPDPSIAAYHKHTKIYSQLVPDLRSVSTEGAAKLIIQQEPALLQQLYAAIKAELAGVCELMFSAPHFLEFGVLGNSKASALIFLSSYLGIDISEVAAVGDNFNDMEMVKAAGFGVAVSNAVDELKAAADFVSTADNNSDAVAEVLALLAASH